MGFIFIIPANCIWIFSLHHKKVFICLSFIFLLPPNNPATKKLRCLIFKSNFGFCLLLLHCWVLDPVLGNKMQKTYLTNQLKLTKLTQWNTIRGEKQTTKDCWVMEKWLKVVNRPCPWRMFGSCTTPFSMTPSLCREATKCFGEARCFKVDS